MKWKELHPDLLQVLEKAGWHAGRTVDIKEDLSTLHDAGYISNPLAEDFLVSLCGLNIQPSVEQGPNFLNGDPLQVSPMLIGGRLRSEALEISGVLGGDFFPIGWWLSYSHVYMGVNGRMVAFANGLLWQLGDTPEAGLDFMIRTTGPLVCIHAFYGLPRRPKS